MLPRMFVYEREIRFHEVDGAGLLFFPRFFTYAHEAMEGLFAPVDGSYAGLILDRRIGLPAVAVHSDFKAPLRYGDRVRVETRVTRLGSRSLELSYRFLRASDGVLSAEMRHTVVCTDLAAMKSTDMPEDVRAVAVAHLEAS